MEAQETHEQLTIFALMLSGKELILATRPFAKENLLRSSMEVLVTLALLAILIAAIVLIPSYILRLPLSIILGLTIVRMFVLYHDFLHKSILNGQSWANLIFIIFGWTILVPSTIWKRSHDYHHNHNSKLYSSSIGSFPIVTREKFVQASRGERLIYLFIRHPLTILFGYVFVFIYGMCIRSLLNNPRRHWDSAIALLVHTSVGTLFYWQGGWSLLIFGWVLPNMVACAMGSYLFYAQHNFPSATFPERDGWTYIGAALQSSSYMKMGSLMRWFTCNIGYHHIHHLNARIPFYSLPEVFSTFNELQDPKMTSLHPRDVWNCLKLKVYDPNLNRMITKNEMIKPNEAIH